MSFIYITMLFFYIIVVVLLYGFLLHIFSNTIYYPYSKSPFLFSIAISMTIGGAIFLIMFNDLSMFYSNSRNIQFIPKFKNNKNIQYCDIEKLQDIWYDHSIINGCLNDIFYKKWKNLL